MSLLSTKRFTKTLAAAATAVIACTVVTVGAYAWNERAAAELSATMAQRVTPLLPEGTIGHVEVTDSPALLAVRRPQVQQTMVDATTADGHPVVMIVREFDRDSGRAASVSWQLGGLPLAPGWTGLRDDRGVYLNAAERHVDGHVVQVSATATLQGTTVRIDVGDVTVDGVPTALADAPEAVRATLAPLDVDVPLPGAANTVRSVWFDEQGVGLDLYARDVTSGTS